MNAQTDIARIIVTAAEREYSPSAFLWYPDLARQNARRYVQSLPNPYYAVKANTSAHVLRDLVAAGFNKFDVASVREIESVIAICPNATIGYMNPVKPFAAIERAFEMGVRQFALDHEDELRKIRSATNESRELTLLVRIALLPKDAGYPMTGKFGADAGTAAMLLLAIKSMGCKAGLTFHVGSQCNSPEMFVEAMDEAAAIVQAAGVALDVLDIGGGFPAAYFGIETPIEDFGSAINAAFAQRRSIFGSSCILQSEPGRAVVACAGSALVRVELRRGKELFLSDGAHGLLSELRWMIGMHPIRRVSSGQAESLMMSKFSVAGPSCDSGDRAPGPYVLPENCSVGDWLEIGFLGAYCMELTTPFNGLGKFEFNEIERAPSWDNELNPAVCLIDDLPGTLRRWTRGQVVASGNGGIAEKISSSAQPNVCYNSDSKEYTALRDIGRGETLYCESI